MLIEMSIKFKSLYRIQESAYRLKMARKSLAEQIAELSKPKKDFDIEDNEFKDGALDDDEEQEAFSSDQEQMKKEHYVKVPKSSLRKMNDSAALGGKYTGDVTSRAEMFGGNEDEDEIDVRDDGSESQEDNDSEGEEESDIGSDEQVEDSRSGEEDFGGFEDGEGVDLSASESEESEDVSEGELQDKRAKLKDILANERKQIVSRLSQSAMDDALKGYAVLQHHKLFDSLIESRLKLQKPLQQSNLLPASYEILKKDKLGSKSTRKNASEAQEKCFDLLDKLFALRRNLFKEDGIVVKDLPRNPKKRTLADYTNHTAKQDALLDSYRSSVLTKWSTKIQNSSGAGAINAGKFKVINQSAEQQVINNLSDMDRLVKRTKINRRNVKPLGYETYLSTLPQKQDDNDQDSDHDSDLEVPQQSSGNSRNDQETDVIFDDDDFYRVLLNDLVDKKLQMNNPTSGMSISIRSAQKASKVKKNIDTKASKGRKLKFTVQEKIANFETPREEWKWDNSQIDEFFASLFGQKINMSENADERAEENGQERDSSESEYEDAVELTNSENNIKLFA